MRGLGVHPFDLCNSTVNRSMALATSAPLCQPASRKTKRQIGPLDASLAQAHPGVAASRVQRASRPGVFARNRSSLL